MIGVADEDAFEKSCRQQSILSCPDHSAFGAGWNKKRDLMQHARADPDFF